MNRYKTYEKQTLFWDNNEKEFDKDTFFLKNIIEDRKSKYSWTCTRVLSQQEVKDFFKYIKTFKYYKKATHNTYAYRIKQEDWSILEWKNDDWELGWWNCILTVMKKRKIVNCMIVITRYFWWIHLNTDRFKHLVDGTWIIIDNIEK